MSGLLTYSEAIAIAAIGGLDMRAPVRTLPSYALLHQLLEYYPESGHLVWKFQPPTSRSNNSFNSKCAGKQAGTLTMGRPDGSNRYFVVGIRVNGKFQQYGAHRIIWKMMTGKDPSHQVDHWDGDELNNIWKNLRKAGHGQNIQNAKIRKDNKSGVKGVHWDAGHKKWRAVISVNKKSMRLGRFDTVAEAKYAIATMRKSLHGDFARMQ